MGILRNKQKYFKMVIYANNLKNIFRDHDCLYYTKNLEWHHKNRMKYSTKYVPSKKKYVIVDSKGAFWKLQPTDVNYK